MDFEICPTAVFDNPLRLLINLVYNLGFIFIIKIPELSYRQNGVAWTDIQPSMQDFRIVFHVVSST